MNHNQRLQKLIANLAQDFSIDKLSKSPARFGLEKLNWFNREYIKLLSLQEFAYLAQKNRLSQKYPDKKLRLGSYAFLIDFETNQTYSENQYSFVGGEIETGEDSISALIRKIKEETNEQFKAKPGQELHLMDFEFLEDWSTWDGKLANLFLYKAKSSELKTWGELDFWKTKRDGGNVFNKFDWIDLPDFIANNIYIKYPIWQDLCLKHNLPLFEPSTQIIQQYLGWNLDKNRITTLSEIGSESDTILNWIKPEIDSLKWKKISLEESLGNLKEISEFIIRLAESPEFTILQTKLYNSTKAQIQDSAQEQYLTDFQNLFALWETTLKTWLSENQRDVGSYFWPLRVALSGKIKSPSPFELLTILNVTQIQSRLSIY